MKIIIVPPRVEYAHAFYKWRNEPATLKFNPVLDLSIVELSAILAKAPLTLSPLDKEASHRWFIELDGEVAGTVSLSNINAMMGTAEIGYMVGERHHGLGIATRALVLWTAMIFNQTDLRKLTASVAQGNSSSIRVLEKSGYVAEGLLREHYLIANRPTNEIVFGLLKREWSQQIE